jgi:hypothetical protein
LWFVCGATLYVVAAGAHTQAPAEPTARAVSCAEEDGCLLSSEPLTLTKPYAQLDDLSKFRFPQAEYDEAKEPARLRVPENHLPQRGSAHRRLYLQAEADDGTEAAGDHLQSRRDFSAIEPEELVTFYFWAKRRIRCARIQLPRRRRERRHRRVGRP